MSTLPQRQIGVFITLGLAVVGAIVAGIILFTSGKASETDLSSARYAPADTGLYIAINTDLTSDQWVAAFQLIERLGEDDPEDELKDSVEDANVDWEDDVVPFLGGNAGVYLRLADPEDPLSALTQGAVIARVNDADRALEVIEDQTGANFRDDDYRGATTYIDDETGLYIGVHDGHMVFAATEDALLDTLDVGTGKDESLASVQDFRTLRDELSKNFLLMVYVNAESLLEGFLEDDGDVFSRAFAEAGVYDLTLKPNAFVIGAKDDSFEGQHAALGNPGAIGPMTTPRDSKLASKMPGETAFFFSSYQLAQTYHDTVDGARDSIDEAIEEGSEYDSLDEALEDAGQQLGLENIEELIDLFTGEVAVGVWFPTDDEDEPEVVFAAEVEDEGEALDVIEDVVDAAGAEIDRQDIGGAEVIIVEDEDGDEFGVTVHDGVLYFGTIAGLEAVLDSDGPRLTEMKRYKDTVKSVPTKLGTYAYFDVAVLLRLESAGIPAQLDDAERALEGAIINVVNERDVIRTSGAITIREAD